MTVLRFVVKLLANIIAVVLLGLAAVLLEASYDPYDLSHPDYNRYAAALHRLKVSIADRGVKSDDALDLSELNAGNWKVACLFGAYTHPAETMRKLGGKLSQKDDHHWRDAAWRGFRLDEVEEFEMAIGYVDLGNNAQFIHLRHGIGAEAQHLERCVSKPKTLLTLDISW